MTNEEQELHDFLESVNEEYGGDIGFVATAVPNMVEELERAIGWRLPSIFKFFLTNESNGLLIGNKRILSVYDKNQKKTWSDNLERNNNPDVSFWFKERPLIFEDYLVVASDGEICFCVNFYLLYEID